MINHKAKKLALNLKDYILGSKEKDKTEVRAMVNALGSWFNTQVQIPGKEIQEGGSSTCQATMEGRIVWIAFLH